MLEINYLALFLAGLLGGGHCAGMCGGIVTAFSLQLPPGARWLHHVGFNLGRLAGYMLIGALLGGLAQFAALGALQQIKQVMMLLSAVLLLLLGLYIAGISSAITRIEGLGRPVWRRVQPLMRRFLPVHSVWQTPVIGFLWGWIPCGLVYTASLAALSTASAAKGAGVMLAFGLGTLPNLLLIGFFAQRVQRWLNQRPVRMLCGAFLVLIALQQFWMGIRL